MTSAAFVQALKPLLEARPALAGVSVHILEPEDLKSPAIVLIRNRIRHDIQYVSFGPRRQDDVTVSGFVRTKGTTLQDAEEKVMAICEEIAQQLLDAPPQVGSQTLDAILSAISWAPYPIDKGGFTADAEFDITYSSDLD